MKVKVIYLLSRLEEHDSVEDQSFRLAERW